MSQTELSSHSRGEHWQCFCQHTSIEFNCKKIVIGWSIPMVLEWSWSALACSGALFEWSSLQRSWLLECSWTMLSVLLAGVVSERVCLAVLSCSGKVFYPKQETLNHVWTACGVGALECSAALVGPWGSQCAVVFFSACGSLFKSAPT